MKVNKFNIGWQIVRTKARAIKDVEKKINYVLSYLNANPNRHNYERVLNWVKMTGVAYPKDSEQRRMFTYAQSVMMLGKDGLYSSTQDSNNDLTKVSTEDLELVLKDLNKRKYGFQFKSVPKDHTEFVERIEDELKNR